MLTPSKIPILANIAFAGMAKVQTVKMRMKIQVSDQDDVLGR